MIKVADAAKGLIPLIGLFAAFRGAQAITQFAGGFGRGFRGAPTQRASEGGPIQYFASGGHVPGFGNGDKVSARLTPGEFVMRKSAVQRIGVGNLYSLNRGGPVQPNNYYQGGVAALKTLSPGQSGNKISEYIDNYENETSTTNKNQAGSRKKRSNRESPKILRIKSLFWEIVCRQFLIREMGVAPLFTKMVALIEQPSAY